MAMLAIIDKDGGDDDLSLDEDAGFSELQDLLPGQEKITREEFNALSHQEQLDFFIERIVDAGLVAASVAREVAERADGAVERRVERRVGQRIE